MVDGGMDLGIWDEMGKRKGGGEDGENKSKEKHEIWGNVR